MNFKKKGGVSHSIPTGSMADITFLLLIFFDGIYGFCPLPRDGHYYAQGRKNRRTQETSSYQLFVGFC